MRRVIPIWATAGFLFLTSCHHGPVPRAVLWDDHPRENQRELLVEDARNLMYVRQFKIQERSFPDDCSGFVGAVLYQNGFDVFEGATALEIRGNGVRVLYDFIVRTGKVFSAGQAEPGDLVFFSNTYDRNRDRKLNDPLTHVGLIERVESDGTITFIHNVHGSVRRYVMNLQSPHQHQSPDGRILNSYLRRKRRSDPKGTSYLAGPLFTSFGSLFSRAAYADPPSPRHISIISSL